jgi:hypothetical protein
MFAAVERALNRRQQGDLGEVSAIEWLTRQGALALLPVGHSPDFDLVAQIADGLVRIQVKTSTQKDPDPERTSPLSGFSGHEWRESELERRIQAHRQSED